MATEITKPLMLDETGQAIAKSLATIADYNKNYIDTMMRRTRLTDFDLTTLKAAVAEQNLEKYGLKVGDKKTINGYTYVIAGLNPMKGTSTPYRLTQNHVGLIVIPHTTHAWNPDGCTYATDNHGAGYMNSELHSYLKANVLTHVQNDLGSGNLLAHSKLLSNAVDQNSTKNRSTEGNGAPTGWAWEENCYISALSEVQVYGSTVWSSSGYDTGEACRQLDVFRHYNHTEIFGGEYIWLRDVVSASIAAHASGDGSANRNWATSAGYVAALVLFN